MRIVILQLIMKEEQAFFMQIRKFSKIQFKIFENYFLKISLHFLVEKAKPFHVICELLF